MVAGGLLGLLGIGSLLIHVPYATIAPGSARPVNPLVAVTGHEVYKPKGNVLSGGNLTGVYGSNDKPDTTLNLASFSGSVRLRKKP